MDREQARDGSQPSTGVIGRLTSPGFRFAVLVPLVVAATIVTVRSDGVGVGGLREVFEGLGVLGPFAFAAVYALAASLLLPAAPFTIGAGLLFGPLVGTAAALVGATAGATGAFLLGRLLGRDAVEQYGGRRVAALDRYLARRGFASVLVVRLVPLFPFNLVNVAAGVAGLRLRVYVLATAIGIVPGTVAYAALGGTVEDPTSPAFLVAVALFLVVTVVAVIASRRMGSAAPVREVAR